MKHECYEGSNLKYTINRVHDHWMMYDTKTHAYVIDIQFCPFCGEKL